MESGLDLEKQIPTPVEAELFFLTSLFIELIGLYGRHALRSIAPRSTTRGFQLFPMQLVRTDESTVAGAPQNRQKHHVGPTPNS